MAARLVHTEAAVIPAGTLPAALKHVSTLDVAVDADGVPTSIEVVNRTKSPLDDAAIAAVKKSQFAPGMLEGEPVPVYAFV
jgi:TonB family protein